MRRKWLGNGWVPPTQKGRSPETTSISITLSRNEHPVVAQLKPHSQVILSLQLAKNISPVGEIYSANCRKESGQLHEDTFNRLRRYLHQLTKVSSVANEGTFENSLKSPYLQRRYAYFVREVLLTCSMKYIFFEKGVYLL